MLDMAEISRITEGVGRKAVRGSGLVRVVAAPTTDSEGEGALRVLVVLTEDAAARMTGDEAIDFLVAMQHELWGAGEERLPIVEYATEEELAQEDRDDVLEDD